ncbi:diguanylate cyclase [Kluyvera sp. 142486]|uniref:diguanylate cyclase n=1 Tax=Kluyvera sp. 142486 TaxID=3390050 RepID=UPI0039807B48
MKSISGKNLQYILFSMVILPLAVMTLSFLMYINYQTESTVDEMLYRFNVNTSFDSIDIPIAEINQTLINMAGILSAEDRIDKYISSERSPFNNKIAAIMNSYSYLNSVMIVKVQSGEYKTYPEHLTFKKDFNPLTRPWFILSSSGKISYSLPYESDNQDNPNNINTSNKWGITASTSIMNEERKILGVIAADLDLKHLSSTLRDKLIPLNGTFLVTTSDGQVINAPNPNDILRKKVPQEWLEKAINPHGSFHDAEGNLVFYKLYSKPSWIAFTYADKASIKAYYNKSMYVFYLTVLVCFVILMTLLFLYITYNKQVVGKLYLDINGVDVNMQSFNINNLSNEITKHRIRYEQIQHDILVDELTHLYNRKKLEEDYVSMVAKGISFNLAIIDLDHFKMINDTFGHIIGDDVLKFVAREGKRILGDENPIYRFGGEELIVIFPGKSLRSCLELLNQWRLSVCNKEWREPALKTSFSGGLVVWQKGEHLDDTIAKADHYLYNAKDAGRNCICTN